MQRPRPQCHRGLSDYSQSFTEAIKAVWPHARFQADHFHTVKNIWGTSKSAVILPPEAQGEWGSPAA